MKYKLNETIATGKFKQVLAENYTKNFELLCQSIKLNKVQQKILDQFINHGTIKNQYVGRVAGVKKEKKFFAAKKQYKGSIDNRNEALMKALKVNDHQKNILDAYLKTGRVIGKYAGSIAGSTKTTKSYSAFRGFKEHFESTSESWELNEGFVAILDLKDADYKKLDAELKKSKDGQKLKGGGPKVKAYKDPDYGGIEWDGVSNSKQFKGEIDKILKNLKIGYESARVLEATNEGFSNWSVEVKTAQISGTKVKAQKVKVKAQSASHAIKLAAKKLGVDWKQLTLGKTKKEYERI